MLIKLTLFIKIVILSICPLQIMHQRILHRDSKFNINAVVMVVSGGPHRAVLLQHKKIKA